MADANARPLGYVTPSERTNEQHDAHAAAVAALPPLARFALPSPKLAKGESVRLFDAWKDPKVVADVGFTFDRIHQQTGSCVWAGGTNALFSTIAMQRVAAENPTKAFLPFTLHNYGMSRHYMGTDSEGDGSMGSTFAKSLTKDGLFEWKPGTKGIPSYNDKDGVAVTAAEEYDWSSSRLAALKAVLDLADDHLLGQAAECRTPDDIKAGLVNGYAAAFACDNNIGHASIQGSGADACVVGYWDSRGGHQQSVHAFWEHPTLGPLFWVQNNWPKNTYPRDPAGGPVCGCWVKQEKVEAAFRLDAEVFLYSHLPWFPAQADRILGWSLI